jgi:DNA-binding protein H-NS
MSVHILVQPAFKSDEAARSRQLSALRRPLEALHLNLVQLSFRPSSDWCFIYGLWHSASIETIEKEGHAMATLRSIQQKIAKLQSQAEAIVKKQSAGVIAKVHAMLAEHGLTVADLGSGPSAKRAMGSAATIGQASSRSPSAKYRDPKSGATWSGHGRVPGWIANAKSRDKFLIDSNAPMAPAAAKHVAKPGNYVRGPQPAKYRDPKSGAEWSGRGKAPSWLASAKDRTKFLIDGGGAGTTESIAAKSGTATKKAVTKVAAEKGTAKVSAKTSAAKKAAAKKTPATAPVKKVAASKKVVEKKAAPAAKKSAQAATKKAVSKKTPAKKTSNIAASEKAFDAATLAGSGASDAIAPASPA